jgi:hypothetical protein
MRNTKRWREKKCYRRTLFICICICTFFLIASCVNITFLFVTTAATIIAGVVNWIEFLIGYFSPLFFFLLFCQSGSEGKITIDISYQYHCFVTLYTRAIETKAIINNSRGCRLLYCRGEGGKLAWSLFVNLFKFFDHTFCKLNE